MEELRCVALAYYLLKVHAAEGRLCDARCASDADSPSPLAPEALTHPETYGRVSRMARLSASTFAGVPGINQALREA